MNALYLREMRRSLVMLVIFGAIITLYVSVIVQMYDPALMGSLDEWVDIMPDIMAAVGMTAGATTLIGFMSSYLYGFILPIVPMVFTILRTNALVAKYVDGGSMVSLVAAPVSRRKVALTQLGALLSGVVLLVAYSTVVELIGAAGFPGELKISDLLLLNAGLLCLQLFIAGICFFASCLFDETRYSIAVGAGVPALMFVLKMLANTGNSAENAKYFTFFTLFNPDALIAREGGAIAGICVLFAGACVLCAAAVAAFSKRDLCI